MFEFMPNASCVRFLLLLWQITTNLVAWNNKDLWFYSFGSQKSKMGLTWLKWRCRQSSGPCGGPTGGPVPHPTAPPGCPCSWTPGCIGQMQFLILIIIIFWLLSKPICHHHLFICTYLSTYPFYIPIHLCRCLSPIGFVFLEILDWWTLRSRLRSLGAIIWPNTHYGGQSPCCNKLWK